MTMQAMASYLALCGNELVNAARLKEYVDRGIAPGQYNVSCSGCDGLIDILPCGFSDPTQDSGPDGKDYTLPELDDAPWYDPLVPESKNFAGLLVTSVTMSSAYSRSVTQNVGQGQTLGRLRKNGRTITVHGFLIGKTCCATQYGLSWLTSALADPCGGSDCGGCDLDFLSCCPNISEDDECITKIDANGDAQIYIRPSEETEFQRGSDFWRRMHGVGVVSGPDIISCRGRNCGCGCGSLIEVEFVLASEQAYLNSMEEIVLDTTLAPVGDCDDGDCGITWVTDCVDGSPCAQASNCTDDPNCPAPSLPPAARNPITLGCGCASMTTVPTYASQVPVREWGETTLNYEIYAGDSDLRNVKVQLWQNPLGYDCDDPRFDECTACSTMLVSFVPAGGTLRFSGEERKVTITCNNRTVNGMKNVSSPDGSVFAWPDLTCVPICTKVTWDCTHTDPKASVKITRVNRDV